MTHQPLTKAERDELRASMHKWRGGHWLHHEHPIYKSVCDGLPRLLADLDAAEAERAKLGNAIGVDFSLHGTLSWVVEGIERIKAQRDRAEAERDALKAKLDDANENLAKSVVVLAESAHSELFLSGQVAELRAKLAALVAAVDVAVDEVSHSMSGRMCALHNYAMGACTCGVQKIRAAIAAARGGAQ